MGFLSAHVRRACRGKEGTNLNLHMLSSSGSSSCSSCVIQPVGNASLKAEGIDSISPSRTMLEHASWELLLMSHSQQRTLGCNSNAQKECNSRFQLLFFCELPLCTRAGSLWIDRGDKSKIALERYCPAPAQSLLRAIPSSLALSCTTSKRDSTESGGD